MSIEQMMPFQQGGLDSLCGIYSVINAVRLVNGINEVESQNLFNKAIEFLNDEQSLDSILTKGMPSTQMNLLLEYVIKKIIPNTNIKITRPYIGKQNPKLKEFWTETSYFLNEPGGRAVILGLNGVHDHWTTVKEITDKQIKLFDSVGLKILNRSACTTTNPNKSRKHVILPAQTFFLSKEATLSHTQSE